MINRTAADDLRRRDGFKYALVIEGVLIGLITGALISVFRLMLTGADKLRDLFVSHASSGIAGALIAVMILLALTVIISLLLGAEPDIAGSGIPQVEAELRGLKDMNWLRVTAAKMLGCALAIGGGLALGREGPSIQIGAMAGKGFARAAHRMPTEERLLITCGAGAGLSAAFGAPLAGALFALEELHRNFSAEVLLSTMAASAASEFVAANVFGLTPVFVFGEWESLPLRHYWAVMLIGIIAGFAGILYNRTIAFMQDLSEKAGKAFAHAFGKLSGKPVFNLTDSHLNRTGESASRTGRLLVAFALAFILIFACPDALGSGAWLVSDVSAGDRTVWVLLALLAVKFIFSTASFGSGSPGGIFLPLLVLGALTGASVSAVISLAMPGWEYTTALVIAAMAGFFAAIVRAPVTGVVLITEMTGDFSCLLPLVLSALVAYLIAEWSGTQPIYEQLMHRSMGHGQAGSGSAHGTEALAKERKIIIDEEIHIGSEMDGRRVRDFGLPLGTLIVSVTRDGSEIIPDGNTILRGGDDIEVLTREQDLSDAEQIIEEKCKTVKER